MMERLSCTPTNAPKLAEWIRDRGGIAVWESINLSNPGASWSTPLLTKEGKPYPKPTWEVGNSPARVIADPNEVDVITYKEFKRFRVGIRRGSSNPFLYKVTDGGTRRINAALEKAGDGSTYTFDRGCAGAEAVIWKPIKKITLKEFIKNEKETEV